MVLVLRIGIGINLREQGLVSLKSRRRLFQDQRRNGRLFLGATAQPLSRFAQILSSPSSDNNRRNSSERKDPRRGRICLGEFSAPTPMERRAISVPEILQDYGTNGTYETDETNGTEKGLSPKSCPICPIRPILSASPKPPRQQSSRLPSLRHLLIRRPASFRDRRLVLARGTGLSDRNARLLAERPGGFLL